MAMSRSDAFRCCTGLPSIRMSPSSIVSRPAMARSVVVLPQPDWPSRTMNSLSVDRQVQVLDDLDGAEELLDAAKLDLGHEWPPLAVMVVGDVEHAVGSSFALPACRTSR